MTMELLILNNEALNSQFELKYKFPTMLWKKIQDLFERKGLEM